MSRYLGAIGWSVAAVVVTSLAGCGGTTASAPGDGGAGTGGWSACKAVNACIARAHVDAICGTTTALTPSIDQGPPMVPLFVDSCDYESSPQTQVAFVQRDCYPDALGGASGAQLGYQDGHDVALGPTETIMDVAGLGDQAYYRSDPMQGRAILGVRKGNVLIVVELDVVTTQNEATLKQSCVFALEAELAAL